MSEAENGSNIDEPGILARRRIEAEIVKPIYEALVREIGKDRARSVIGRAIKDAAVKAGREFAAKEPNRPNLQSFIDLQHLWAKDDALELEVLHQDNEHYDYNVKRCRYAEMYEAIGLGEIGPLLSCARDSHFIVGYAPDIMLERTQTLMQGGSCCDFRYTTNRKTGKR